MTDTFKNIRDVAIVANEPLTYRCTLELTNDKTNETKTVTYFANNVNVTASLCSQVFEAIEKLDIDIPIKTVRIKYNNKTGKVIEVSKSLTHKLIVSVDETILETDHTDKQEGSLIDETNKDYLKIKQQIAYDKHDQAMKEKRKQHFLAETDSLFFKEQRNEVDAGTWETEVNAIKVNFPYNSEMLEEELKTLYPL